MTESRAPFITVIRVPDRGWIAVYFAWTYDEQHSNGGFYDVYVQDSVVSEDVDSGIRRGAEWANAEGVDFRVLETWNDPEATKQ